MARSAALFVVVSLGWLNVSASAQTPYPMLMSLKPVAAQVGQASEHTVSSRYSLRGAYRVLVTGQGVAGEVIPPKEDAKNAKGDLQAIKVRFTVADNAKPGVREFRLATPQGVSTVGQLVIVRDPVVSETGKNNTPEQAVEFKAPATLCGAIESAEDVDYFKFKASAGQSLSFHVRCMRLQDKIHDLQQHADPIITLRSAGGGTLAASDNYFRGDPFLGFEFKQDGEYLLEIRDVRYQGNRYWEYSVEVSDQPFVTQVFPMGLRPGEETKLRMVGFHTPAGSQVAVHPAADAECGRDWLQLPLAGGVSNPAPVVFSDLPVVLETDAENGEPEAAQQVEAPCGINGRIEQPGDIDCFSFLAKKGESYSFEVVARRQQSQLDSHLRILDEKGKQLALNDDMKLGVRTFADSWLEAWKAPADGKYVIEIRDLHLQGGDDFVYFLSVSRSEPYFELYLDTDKTELTPGTGGAIFVNVQRKNGFDGEVQLDVEGLPAGVTADCGRILTGKNQDGCLVLRGAGGEDGRFAVERDRLG